MKFLSRGLIVSAAIFLFCSTFLILLVLGSIAEIVRLIPRGVSL